MYDTKYNYYALMLSVFKGYGVEKSLRMMGIDTQKHNVATYVNRGIYKHIGRGCAVIHISTGMSYSGLGRVFNLHYSTIQHAIRSYKGKIVNG